MPKMRTVTSLCYCHRVVMICFHRQEKAEKKTAAATSLLEVGQELRAKQHMLRIKIKVSVILVRGILTSL